MSDILVAALDHHKAGHRAEAEALYRQALAADPHEPTSLYLYGLFNFEAGRVDAAAELFKAVIATRPDHAEGHVALANLRHWQDAYGAAIEGYRAALALAPDHPGALLGLVEALRAHGDAAASVEAAQDATRRLPQAPAAWLALGATLMADERAAEAAEAFRAALALDLALVDAHAGLARALLHQGLADQALVAVDAALGLAQQSGEVWFLLGTALNALGDVAQAAPALERAAALEPQRAAIHLNLGNLYVELGQADSAAASLRLAIDLEPTLKEAHASLASVYVMADQMEAAEHHALLALELDPEMTVAHQNLAAVHMSRGETEAARWRRDQVYGRQNLFVERAVHPERTVLVISTAGSGNVPHRDLLPRRRFTRLNWVIEYATEGQAETLPPFDAVFNAVGDADLAEPARGPTEAFLAQSPLRVINAPARIAETSRDQLPLLLAGLEDVVVPAVARLSAEDLGFDSLERWVARTGLSYPVLARPMGSHGGRGLVRAEGPKDLAALDLPPGHDLYVTDYHEFESADGWRRKYRMIFVDRRPYPYHLAIARDWLVHYESADMPDDPVRVAEERHFLDDPAAALGARAMAAIEAIGRRIDLDYCGIDFSVLPDGRVLVFEANATMLVHREAEGGPLAHKNAPVEAICTAFQALLYR